ncbi:putative late blight resistance protein homolog R1B-16 [Solanum lycopersicum]|uniref:putative late blight resistance protein homolog R1B-16 n=1 Tax=Solanum lycopersicum TaxID=4081 RepID=UPI0037493F0F
MSNLCRGRYFDISPLEKIVHEWDLGSSMEHKMDCLNIDFQFLNMLLSLQSFTRRDCLDTTVEKVEALWDAAEFERINCIDDVKLVLDKMEEEIWETKIHIEAKYSFPIALISKIATLDPEFVKRFIDTVIMNITDLPKINRLYTWSRLKQIQEAVKELKLLRNFVYFISDRCTNPQSQYTFFSHVLVVAGHVAMISWFSINADMNFFFDPLKLDALFSDLQMRIQPIQPGIHEIYIDVLQALKSGSHPNIDVHAADYKAGFVETLVHHMEVLRPIIHKHEKGVAFKDQITMLNFLRDNLINLPREAVEDFDTGIINVGLLVYSVFKSVALGKSKRLVPVLDFSGDIQSIQALVYFLTRNSFCSNLPKIDGLGSIDIILDQLEEFLSCYSELTSSIRSQIQKIQQQLEHFQKQNDGFGSFGMQVITKAYEVDHVVVGYINKDIPEWCLFLWTRDIIEEITQLIEAGEIHGKEVSDSVLHNTTDVANADTSQLAQMTSMSEEMVGFQDVMYTLRGKLIRGSSKLDVISIVGMPGLGKTTIANKLFFDQLVVSHFDVRAQCCVSQVYTRKDLLLTILRSVKKDTVVSDKLPEDVLADKLRKLLMVQRYLILIDDVWETVAWDDLKPSFYDANNGSRIILTTRLGDVANDAKFFSDPHFLRLFTQEESWMLLKTKVFNAKSCPLVLEDVGQRIAKRCGGLPLSVVLVAGILETTEKETNCWEQVAINLGSHIQAKSEDIINLSYQALPFHLKPCFLYFGVFLEDEEIQVSKLTWLWIAEGLVRSHKEKPFEDIAEDHLKNLIGRNLVMVSKMSSDGKSKSCRIHDLLLDFCKKKAKVENFLQCIKGDNDMNPSSVSCQKHNISRRLCLDVQADNLAKWSSICSDVQSFHLMKGRQIGSSSVSYASHIFNSFKFLWVLDLEFTVIDSFPKELTCLRYVAVKVAEDSSLSFSDNLWNLETLIVKGLGGRVTLPDTLWKMVKLRHLHIYNRAVFNINNALQEMDGLTTLSSPWFSCAEDADRVFAEMPNLQKLRCEVLSCNSSSPSFNNLTKLEMLKFSWGRRALAPTLKLPPSLKTLTLSSGCISSLDEVATLPRLVVLKLLNISLTFDVWEVTDEQFPHLKFLKLQDPSFFEWNVSDDAFPCLENLVLTKLRHIEQIPSRFEDMMTLKSIEVRECKESLVESAKEIRETKVEEMQNSDFKLFVHK